MLQGKVVTSAILALAILGLTVLVGLLVRSVLKRADAAAGIMRDRDLADAARVTAEGLLKHERDTSAKLRAQREHALAELATALDDLDGCDDTVVVRDRLQRLFPLPETEVGSGPGDIAVPAWVAADPAPDPVDG